MPSESSASAPPPSLTAPPIIHIISDSLGDSAATMAAAAASQFSDGNVIIERLPKVTTLDQIKAFVEEHLSQEQQLGNNEMVLYHTIADVQLRAELEDYLLDKPVAQVDLIGPAIDAIAEATGRMPKGKPGLIRKTNQEYFNRVEALEFAVDHDDGRNTEQLDQADIVIIGVSRTSKTPLSIYLATQGYKVANVPLAAGVEPPKQLYDLDKRRIFGLTSQAGLLSEIRYRRLGDAKEVAGSYAEPGNVQADLDQARALMRRLGCIVVRTDNRAIEETAQEILRYWSLSFKADV
jgi:regulator of PEP synthase PpsR (kinase-PPPase family)